VGEERQAQEGPALVLTRRRYAEVVANLLALRALASELEEVFAAFERPGPRSAAGGARTMVETVDRVLDELGYAGGREVA
jgi:hypothetical protein